MELTFEKLAVTAHLKAAVADRYALFRCREPYQEIFRRVTDCRGDGCEGCRRGECAFGGVFAQSLSSDPSVVKRHQKPPLPFAFQFPVLSTEKGGERHFEICLTLVGSAIQHAHHFIASLERYLDGEGEGAPAAVIEAVETLGYFGERSVWGSGNGGGSVKGTSILLAAEGLRATRILGDSAVLALETPLKIIQEGRAQRSFAFSPFFRALMRRVSALASAYGEGEMEVDFPWLARTCGEVIVSNSAIRWTDWRSGSIGGLTGEAVISGSLEEFVPFLLLGEYLNVGKGASFGLGRFSVRLHPR